MNSLRQEIDIIDEAIVKLLSKRFTLTNKVGIYKHTHSLPPVDKNRERMQMRKFTNLSKIYKLKKALVLSIYRLIIDEVVQNHIKISKSNE